MDAALARRGHRHHLPVMLALLGVGLGTGLAVHQPAPTTAPAAPPADLVAGPATAYLLQLDELPSIGFRALSGPSALSATEITGGSSDAYAAELTSASGLQVAGARYFRDAPDLSITNGPVDIISTAVVAGDPVVARRLCTAAIAHWDAEPGAVALSTGPLGDQAHGDQFVAQGPGDLTLVQTVVIWRWANLVSILEVRGRRGGTGLSDSVALARRVLDYDQQGGVQQERVRAPAPGSGVSRATLGAGG